MTSYMFDNPYGTPEFDGCDSHVMVHHYFLSFSNLKLATFGGILGGIPL